jgi:hypothetical protein
MMSLAHAFVRDIFHFISFNKAKAKELESEPPVPMLEPPAFE